MTHFVIPLFVDQVSHIIASNTADENNSPTSGVITSETGTELSPTHQSNVAENQSPEASQINFRTEDQSASGLKLEHQSLTEEDQSAETEEQSEFTVARIDEGTDQLIINFDLVRI